MECPAASRVPASHSGENALSMNVSEIKVVKDPWATERCDFLVSLAEFSCAFRVNVGITYLCGVFGCRWETLWLTFQGEHNNNILFLKI